MKPHPFNLALLALITVALIVNQYWLALGFAYGVVGYHLGKSERQA